MKNKMYNSWCLKPRSIVFKALLLWPVQCRLCYSQSGGTSQDTTQSVMWERRRFFVWVYESTWSASVCPHCQNIFISVQEAAVLSSWDTVKVCWSRVCTFQVLLCMICFRHEVACAGFQKVHRWFLCVCVCITVLSLRTWLSAVLTGGCFERCCMTPGPCCFCRGERS